MGIYEDVSQQMKDAMRARDKDRLSALRGIRAALLVAAKETGADRVEDNACVTILRRLAKQRAESIDAYSKAGREEQAAVERAEKDIIETFLPQLADRGTTHGWVTAAIEQLGATSAKDIGRVMGAVMREHRGQVDGALARQIAAECLRDGSE